MRDNKKRKKIVKIIKITLILSLIFLVVLVFSLIKNWTTVQQKLLYETVNVSPLANVSVQVEGRDKYPPNNGGAIKSMIDDNEATWYYLPIPVGGNNIEFEWDKSWQFGAIELYFAEGRVARDYDLEYFNGQEWVNFQTTRDNQDPDDKYIFLSQPIVTRKMRVHLTRTEAYDTLQHLAEIRFFHREYQTPDQIIHRFIINPVLSVFNFWFGCECQKS